MKQVSYRLKISLFLSVLLIATSCSASLAESRSEPCMNLIRKDSRSISELVDQAEFIGLYEILTATKDNTSIYADRDSYTYQISILDVVKRGNSRVTRITGQKPLSNVPQDYLVLDRLHAEIPEDDPEKYGRSELLISSDGKRCLVAPRFMNSYKYLMFGGLDSSMAFEPVHHDSDPWYQRVIAEVEGENP